MKILNVQGQEVLVDDEDYDHVAGLPWYISHSAKKSYGYVVYATKRDPKTHKQKRIRMHRLIMNETSPKVFIDHINHNTQDNRKRNLRRCTRQQNGFNRKKNKNMTSTYKGVCWSKGHKKWVSCIKLDGKNIYIGHYDSEIEAHEAYKLKAIELFGEFARFG
jgi:hypothetical protein